MSAGIGRIEAVVLDVDGVLTDGRLYYGASGEQLKVFHARDGMGMAMLRDAGVRMGVVSGRRSPVIEKRLRELGVGEFLTGRMDKATAFAQLLARWGLEPAQVAAIGDDVVDVPMLRRAGLGVCPADAEPAVCAVADRVLRARGGSGAVRELCEIVLRSRGEWEAVVERFELPTGTEAGGGH